jgi:hypothetical protein
VTATLVFIKNTTPLDAERSMVPMMSGVGSATPAVPAP